MIRIFIFFIVWGLLLLAPYAAIQHIDTRKRVLWVFGPAVILLGLNILREGALAFENDGSIFGMFFINLVLLSAVFGSLARLTTLRMGGVSNMFKRRGVEVGGFLLLIAVITGLMN